MKPAPVANPIARARDRKQSLGCGVQLLKGTRVPVCGLNPLTPTQSPGNVTE